MAEEEPIGAEEVEKTVQSEAADGSSEDWKARLKLPLVDTRYTTELCEGDLHTIVQMGFAQNTAHQSLQGSNQALAMKSEF